MTTTLKRNINHVHTTSTQFLLNNQGTITAFKRCINPEQHKGIATYYRAEAQLDVCDICNESKEWFIENLWRYPVTRQKMLVALLKLEIAPVIAVSVVERPESVEDIVSSSENDVVLEPSQDVVECCSSCGDVDISCVGMDGESLCKRCWSIVLNIIGR